MKKMLALLLAAAMVLSLLSACTDGKKNNEATKKETVEAKVIYDDKDIKITVTEMRKTTMGIQLAVEVQNASQNSILFTSNCFVVNGVTVTGGCFTECAAGGNVQDTIFVYNSELQMAGIDTVATIRGMDCVICDSETFESIDTFTFDLDTSARDYEQKIDRTGDVLLEEQGIQVISQEYTHKDYGRVARLLMINNMDKTIIVEAEEVKVNDKRVEGWMNEIVFAGTACYSDLDLYSKDLPQEIKSMSFKLVISDNETYEQILETDEIVINIG